MSLSKDLNSMSLIDTHAHLLNEYYTEQDWNDILSTRRNDLGAIINVACNLDQARECIFNYKKLSQILSCPVFIALGIHPHQSLESLMDVEELSDLIQSSINNSPIVAIGECGLDYHYHPYSDSNQKKYFIKQIEIAQSIGLPLIMHCRDAWKDFLDIVLYHQINGVIHSFTGDRNALDTLLERSNIFIGINGIITFTKDKDQLNVFSDIPINKLLLETDSPYLAPVPLRGKKNNPYYIHYIASFMAQLTNRDLVDVCEQTFNNACNLFKLTLKNSNPIIDY